MSGATIGIDMRYVLEIIGISLQTFAGLIFIIEQTSHLDKTKILNKIVSWFESKRAQLSTGLKSPQKYLILITFIVFAITMGIFLYFSESDNKDIIPITIFGLLFVLIIGYSVYIASTMSVLSIFFQSHREFIFKPPKIKRNKYIKSNIETKYYFDVDKKSEKYKQKFDLANIIIFVTCLIVTIIGLLVLFNSSRLTSNNVMFLLLFFLMVLGFWVILMILLLSFLYLLFLVIFKSFKLVISMWWIFLLGIWLSGGILLISSVIIR